MEKLRIWLNSVICFYLLHEFVDGIAEIQNGVFIALLHRLYDAVAEMLLEDLLACVIQSGANRCQLDQHLGAVLVIFHHALDLLQMADGPGKAVGNGLFIGVDMGMAVAVDGEEALLFLMHNIRSFDLINIL